MKKDGLLSSFFTLTILTVNLFHNYILKAYYQLENMCNVICKITSLLCKYFKMEWDDKSCILTAKVKFIGEI